MMNRGRLLLQLTNRTCAQSKFARMNINNSAMTPSALSCRTLSCFRVAGSPPSDDRNMVLMTSSMSKTNSLNRRSFCSGKTDGEEFKQLRQLVTDNKVFLFMKGTPEQPMCGFSNAVTQILRMHGVPYSSCNVLDDESLREGVKKFSDWPTIPQLYVDGEFVGGCDILIEMHRSGDLIETLQKAGIKSALADKDSKAKDSD